MIVDTKTHYDMLIEEGNDPVHDPLHLKEDMNKWDGNDFIGHMRLTKDKTVLEIGIGTGRLTLRVAPYCNIFHQLRIANTCATYI